MEVSDQVKEADCFVLCLSYILRATLVPVPTDLAWRGLLHDLCFERESRQSLARDCLDDVTYIRFYSTLRTAHGGGRLKGLCRPQCWWGCEDGEEQKRRGCWMLIAFYCQGPSRSSLCVFPQ